MAYPGNTTPEGARIRRIVEKRADLEAELYLAVTAARAAGMSWRQIGPALGTTWRAAQYRFARASEPESA
jgi:hypothetical protein